MGAVFRGRDVRSKRDVAVKIIVGVRPDEAARFAREAQILAGFSDPAVVGYVAHGADYLVMEWVEGENLRQRLDRDALAARDAVAAGRQLAGALAALHAVGIVHRDVKPANIMIAGHRIVLVDFGIARSAATVRITRTGMHVGTAGYMAPEQARGDHDITGSADLFALGCVLYECLAGAPAFRGDTAIARRAMVLLHDPPRLRAVAPGLPAALDQLVMRMLARDPAARPAAAEVAAALAAIDLDGAPDPAIATEVADATTEPSPGPAPDPAVATYALVVALDDVPALAEVPALAGGSAARFSGGAATTRLDPGAAAELALELAAQLPDAVIAIACGRSSGEAIELGARLIEQLEIAAAAGERVTGAWVDPSAAGAGLGAGLGAGFAVEPHGSRLRLRGRA